MIRIHIDLQSINVMTEFFERGYERQHLEFSSIPLALILSRRSKILLTFFCATVLVVLPVKMVA